MSPARPDRVAISVLIPTLNEAKNLPDCLDSLSWADEVVVIDSGSSDRTCEVATGRGARVLVHPFDTWSNQRNRAAQAARHDWLLCIDADERVSPELEREIRDLLARGPDAPGYRIPRRATFGGRRIRHCGWGRDRVLRLYHRARGTWEPRLVHEKVVLDAPAGELRGVLIHHTAPDFLHAADKERRYAALGAEEMFRSGRRVTPPAVLLRPALRFVKMYLIDRGFLDGMPGLLVCGLGAWGVFLKYARLWELGRGAAPKP